MIARYDYLKAELINHADLATPDGVGIRFARWEPPPGRKGTLCVFPGRAEFIEKYFEVVNDARERGFAVAMIDWRGQGLSQRALGDRNKGYVRSFSDYELDLETFVKEVVLPDCPPPLFALGHSMGGTVLLRSAHRGRRWFDRMVLSAPMIALAGSAASRSAKLTARSLRYLGLGGALQCGPKLVGGVELVPDLVNVFATMKVGRDKGAASPAP